MHFTGWNLLLLVSIFGTIQNIQDGDLCRWMNGRKYYIDGGESGLISAENVTSQIPLPQVLGLKGSLFGNDSNHPQIPQRCSVELITCASCHFRVSVIRMNIPTCSTDGSCRCDFVWIKEAAYSKSGQEFCGFVKNETSNLYFESKTKLVSVDFLYTGSHADAFVLQFSAIKNVYIYKGGYDYYHHNNTGVITSPNFPGGYPSDYSAEYIIQNTDTTGFVQLLFTDFQLSLWSYMEILDSNGSRIDVYNGNTFRPPALISSGPIMTVKFQANEEYPSSGFRAVYNLVSYAEKYWINRPSTDCGGFVEDHGGAITMMNMVPGNVMRSFDCIWLIKPQNSITTGLQISVRVAQFEEMGSKSTLTIRKGLFSESPVVESITPFQQHKLRRGQEYVVDANTGFYIRLNGYFNNRSHLAIIYSTFKYEGCYAVGDLECGNGRCIKIILRCDGFNHCGDGTDEASCYGANPGITLPEDENWWRTLTPNYYFPKSDSSPSSGTNTLILVTSLAGLGMFVLTTIVILVKLHKQRQDDTISREILQTISADIEAENSQYNQIPPSDPPLYDPPPSYDDVIKYYLPPPPAYNSVSHNHNSGSEQRASDQTRGGNTRDRARRIRGASHHPPILHESAESTILRVNLPEENSNHIRDDSPVLRPNNNSQEVLTASSSADCCMVQSSKSINQNILAESSNAVFYSSPHTDKNKTFFLPPRVKRPNKKDIRFFMERHKALYGETSSKQKSNGPSAKDGREAKALSPIFPQFHRVIVKPSRSKSLADDHQRKVKRTSLNKETSSPPPPQASANISCRLTHRRTSSGPSEISVTDHETAEPSANSPATASPSQKKKSPQQILPCGNSLDDDTSGNNNILPSGWGVLWHPTKKKTEREEVVKVINEANAWRQSDKQPLLKRDSSRETPGGSGEQQSKSDRESTA